MKTTKFKILLSVFLLAAVGCMLCSCQTNNDLSEQSVQPKKSPQQVLKEQPIDDTHDAFLVDTGGKLGTLLITAELGEKDKNEGELPWTWQKITFSVWNPKKMEQPIQTFSKKVTNGVAPEFHNVADANFDGFQDFGYLSHRGIQPMYYHYWLWDEKQEQFIYCNYITSVSNPQFDAEKQVVTSYHHDSAVSGVYRMYRWIDGELTLLRQIEYHYPEGDTQLATVEDLIDGKIVEVYRTEWDWEDKTITKPFLKWYDLDYHGEPK